MEESFPMMDIISKSKGKILPMARLAGKVLFAAVAAIALLFAAKRAGDYYVLQTIRSPLSPEPVRVVLQPPENIGSYRAQKFAFTGSPGETVPVMAALPSEQGRRYPAIIFLYGIGMKMKLYSEVADAVTSAGFALFIPEQYDRGERRDKKRHGLREFLAVRRRIVLTIQETRRLADVLAGRSDIDPQRIYLWGASFGAMAGCSAMAYDPRLKAAVFTVAAGDFQLIAADSPYLQKKRFFSWEKVLAPLGAEFLRPFDPILHAGRIAPRPLLFQNTIQDELLPRSSVEALYNASGQPKEIRWYDSPHDRPVRKALEEAVRDGLAWLQEQDKCVELQMH